MDSLRGNYHNITDHSNCDNRSHGIQIRLLYTHWNNLRKLDKSSGSSVCQHPIDSRPPKRSLLDGLSADDVFTRINCANAHHNILLAIAKKLISTNHNVLLPTLLKTA